MKKQTTQIKDIWDKLDVIFKGIAGILISGAIALYGIKTTTKQTEIAEANRRAQILVQTMNHREESASQMRAQMFKTLMEHYFQEKNDEKTQIIILELIGLNFQDHIHLKPLFKRLDLQLANNVQERKALRKVSSQIKRSEINRIVGSGGESFTLDLSLNKTQIVEPYSMISLTLLEVQEDHVRISSNAKNDSDGFEVTFYDTPFMDNSRLGELTYSVLLSSVDPKNNTAKIKVVILPKHYYSSRNNLRFDAMIGDLLEKVDSE